MAMEEKLAEVEGGPESAARGGEREAGPARGLLREYFESGVVTFVMALFFMTFVAQAAEVPSASMENTIYVGDRFLINKFIFAPGPPAFFLPQRDIRRGDIIVFKYPSDINTNKEIVRYKTLFIKRVVGLPGETIEVRGNDVLINGQILAEHKVTTLDEDLGEDRDRLEKLSEPPGGPSGPYTVYYQEDRLARATGRGSTSGFNYAVGEPFAIPPGHYFMMGDNRDNSADSRVWGPVPRELVVGRGMFVIWSYDKSAPQSQAVPPFNLLSDLLSNTRWRRIGTFLR